MKKILLLLLLLFITRYGYCAWNSSTDPGDGSETVASYMDRIHSNWKALDGTEATPPDKVYAVTGFDVEGAADMDYGSADVTDHTFITDGTGDGEIVLPNDSIGDAEINWGGITAVSARAYLLGAAQSVVTATWTKVLLNAETHDTQGAFASNKYTVVTAGVYIIQGSVFMDWAIDGKLWSVAIYKNGAQVAYNEITADQTNNDIGGVIVGDTQNLSAADYIELYVYHNEGSNMNVQDGTPGTFLTVTQVR